MKFLVISDIHGGASSLERALAVFEKDCDALIVCGDYLNHGPRNPLPDGWDTKRTAELLNARKDRIICARGNCDSEVDQMMLEFPCLNAYTTIAVPAAHGMRRVFVHHGHLYSREELSAWLPKGSLVISGHTHVTTMEKDGDLFYFNPGSVSLPKCDDGKTCGILEIDDGGSVRVSLYSTEGMLIRGQEF